MWAGRSARRSYIGSDLSCRIGLTKRLASSLVSSAPGSAAWVYSGPRDPDGDAGPDCDGRAGVCAFGVRVAAAPPNGSVSTTVTTVANAASAKTAMLTGTHRRARRGGAGAPADVAGCSPAARDG